MNLCKRGWERAMLPTVFIQEGGSSSCRCILKAPARKRSDRGDRFSIMLLSGTLAARCVSRVSVCAGYGGAHATRGRADRAQFRGRRRESPYRSDRPDEQERFRGSYRPDHLEEQRFRGPRRESPYRSDRPDEQERFRGSYRPDEQRFRGRRRESYRPDRPEEQERQRDSVEVPDGWGWREDGLKEPWNAPWYKKMMSRGQVPLVGMESELKTLDRKLIQDFADALDQGKVEVLEQSNISAARSRYQVSHPSELGRIERKLWKSLPAEERPTLFPHFRKAYDWDAQEQKKGQAPEHFFSQKQWNEVAEITEEVAELAKSMQLPRPSRIQFLSFQEIAKGECCVVADQSGSGKTLAYLLPLLQRYVLSADPADRRLKVIIVAPTSDLVHQIAEVAQVASSRSERGFQVTSVVGGGGENARRQRRQLQNGTEVLVATPGRLKFFMEEDYVVPKDTWQSCKAVVIDEVDALVEEGNLKILELKAQLRAQLQWVFVTATVSEVAQMEIQALEAQLQVEAQDLAHRTRRILWTKGPGLHRVPVNCEHVLVDCTPLNLYEVEPEKRLSLVMKHKIQALVWHLKRGVMRDEEDNRVIVFCNTIENCSRVHQALEEVNPDDPRSGSKLWKLLVLHGLRDKKEYEANMALFSTEKVPSVDFFKRRIMICTDRLSRGMDFNSHTVKWVVLMDWPRDAREYIRRVGRTARAGEGGSILTLLCGNKEAAMGKQIAAAAIRSLRLTTSADTEKTRCLERFDPTAVDWRSPKAAARKPLWKPQQEIDREAAEEQAEDQRELSEQELRELFEEADMGPMGVDLWEDEEEEMRAADKGWSPWQSEGMADEDDENLWDDNPFDENRIGISLND